MAGIESSLRRGRLVRIADRPATPQEVKAGCFFEHFRGLRGTIHAVFGDEAAVDVDIDELPDEIRVRHLEMADQMRDRWLGGLPDEVRRKLTAEQKQISLRYVVLVRAVDLEKRRYRRRQTGPGTR